MVHKVEYKMEYKAEYKTEHKMEQCSAAAHVDGISGTHCRLRARMQSGQERLQ